MLIDTHPPLNRISRKQEFDALSSGQIIVELEIVIAQPARFEGSLRVVVVILETSYALDIIDGKEELPVTKYERVFGSRCGSGEEVLIIYMQDSKGSRSIVRVRFGVGACKW